MSNKDMVIKSLTHAVQRLADTLGTKEAELEAKAVELEIKVAELKMKDRADVDLENKMLDQLIEIAELKNHVTDLTEGRDSLQGTPTSQQWKNQRTPATSDDFTSFQGDATAQGRCSHCGKENIENGRGENTLENLKAVQAQKPLLVRRRSSGLAFSKLFPKKHPRLKAGLGGRSLFTKLERKRLSWDRSSGAFPKLIPRHISTNSESSRDDVSDLSFVL